MNIELFSHPLKSCTFVMDFGIPVELRDISTRDSHLHSFCTFSKQIKLLSAFQTGKAQKQNHIFIFNGATPIAAMYLLAIRFSVPGISSARC